MAVTVPEGEIDNALNAEWIIAVGIDAADQTADLEQLIDDAISSGRFGFLAQDTPTNNSADELTPYELVPRDAVAAAQDMTLRDLRAQEDASGDGETQQDPHVVTDADLLAAALGVDRTVLYGAPGARNSDVRKAKDMARVVLPGLVDSYFKVTSIDQGFSRDDLVSFLAEYAVPRGTLPAVRFGRNPYGVLPLSAPDKLTPPAGLGEAERALFEHVRDHAHAVVEASRTRAGDVPVIQPGDKDVDAKLEKILETNAVSKRLDVDEHDFEEDLESLWCPYVENDKHRPADYLTRVMNAQLPDLENPDASDTSWPLLYRLARLSREVMAKDLTGKVNLAPFTRRTVAGASIPVAKRSGLSSFNAALARLSGLPAGDLEVVLMEILDLVNYRMDAWLAGLADWRLKVQRPAESRTGIGYYGFLGKLRPKSATGSSDGYIQAPSVTQATAAGLLRSAALRFKAEGAFNINLSSARARKGAAILELLAAGMTLREALGYRAERWLHDHQGDALIYTLREAYPLSVGMGSDDTYRRLVDGLALAEDALADVKALASANADKAKLGDVHAQSVDALDSLSDLVVAEAVYHLAIGNTGAANAWVKVLSGDPVPGLSAFLHTRRTGQGASHRVSMVCAPQTAAAGSPRTLAEPTVAGLANDALKSFADCRIRVAVFRSAAETGGAPVWGMPLSLKGGLGMEPMDLLVGGANEILVRARWFVVSRWRDNQEMADALGPLPERDVGGYINQTMPLRIDLDFGTPSANDLLARIAPLRDAISNGRPLEAVDLNAASMATPLVESEICAQLMFGIRMLAQRARRLHGGLARLSQRLARHTAATNSAALEMSRLLDAGTGQMRLSATWERLCVRRDALDQHLVAASRYAIPQALRLYADAELVSRREAYFDNVAAVQASLDRKKNALAAVRNPQVSVDLGQIELERIRAELVSALQAACDGAALPVWPPFSAAAKVRPKLEQAGKLADVVGHWTKVRPALRPFVAHVAADAGLAVWRADQAVTMVGAEEDPFARPESEVPLNRYFGIHVGTQTGPLAKPRGGTRYCGVVVDEWSEFRPSKIQNTGLAVNYDSPQSEPPHALLLGVAGNDDLQAWTDADAVALVQEVIRLMQVRAMASTDATAANVTGHLFNVVPPIEDTFDKRIPSMKVYRADIVPGLIPSVTLVSSLSRNALKAGNLNERSKASKKGN